MMVECAHSMYMCAGGGGGGVRSTRYFLGFIYGEIENMTKLTFSNLTKFDLGGIFRVNAKEID